MNPESMAELTRAFEEKQVKSRRGGGGVALSYVEGALVVERLNLAFGHKWSWTIVDRFIDPAPKDRKGNLQSDITVIGRLTAPDGDEVITKEAFGGVRVGASGKGECRADDLKAAATDALKKAASLFGVALHLYSDEVDTSVGEQEAERPRGVERHQLKEIGSIMKVLGWTGDQVRAAANGKPANKLTWDEAEALIKGLKTAIKAEKKEGASGSKKEALPPAQGVSSAKSSKLTERQFKAVEMIARSIGWTIDALRLHCTEVYNAPLEELSKDDASLLIGELQKITVKGVA